MSDFRVHDHFDGSAHCVECFGKCKLAGAELALTTLVRIIFESWAIHGQAPNYMTKKALAEVCDVQAMRKRATDAWAESQPPVKRSNP